MSEKVYARVLFDRRKELAKRGKGKVDIIITLSRKEIKYVTVTQCTALEWRDYRTSPELLMRVAMYNDIAKQMANLGEEMTKRNFEAHLDICDSKSEKMKKTNALSSPTGFLDFMRECIKEGEECSQNLEPQGAGHPLP